MSSKKSPSTVKAADKAIVSFNSDSDEDDSSTSSKLSSPASSDDSDVENFTLTASKAIAKKSETKIDSKDQKVSTAGSKMAETPAVKVAPSLEQKKREEAKAGADADRISALVQSRLFSKLNVDGAAKNEAKDGASKKSLRLSPGKHDDTGDESKESRNKTTSVSSERAKSPKITIEDVDSPKTAKKDDEVVSKTKKTSKPPKDITEDDTVQSSTKVSKEVSPGADDLKKPSKKSSKVAASDDRDRSPGSRSEGRAKSPRKSSDAEKAMDREKTAKNSSEGLGGEAAVAPSAGERVKTKKTARKTAEGSAPKEEEKEMSVTAVRSGLNEAGPNREAVVGQGGDSVDLIGRASKAGGPVVPSAIEERREAETWKAKIDLDSAADTSSPIRVTAVEGAKGESVDTWRTQKNHLSEKEEAGPGDVGSHGGRKDELLNEESDFSYRRKSMDEFIKRILAEAREEKLKQKHGKSSGADGSSDEARKTDALDGFGERNGDLDDARWTKTDQYESTLDRRLANIEKRKQAEAATNGEVSEGRSKVSRDLGENEKNKSKSSKDAKDYEVNLDDDLEEINRFLQSRKSAASRFNFDDAELANDATPTKRRWMAVEKDANHLPPPQQQQQLDDDDVASQDSSRSSRKKYSVDLDFNDEDERFLARFKRDSALPEDSFAPRRREETTQIVREKTRNVRVLVDHQVEIIKAMRNTSKGLDELDKEIREVRQVCLDRRAKISALEGAIDSECRAFENDQLAAAGRQQRQIGGAGEMMADDLTFGRLRRQDKVKSESLDEENFPFRRRSGSVASNSSYGSVFAPGRGVADPANDFRPPRASDFRRTESESDYPPERRRGGSASRSGMGGPGDGSSFGLDDGLLGQRPARSRASIATSTPAIDFSGNASGDSFLAKIRAKYNFLPPSTGVGGGDISGLPPARISGLSSSSSYATPSFDSNRYNRQFSIEQTKQRVKEILASSPYGTTGRQGGSRFSIADSSTSGYSGGGFSSSSLLDTSRMRRAQSVSEVPFDRPSASPTLGSSYSSTSGQFHSRFLDKVRGKKAMGDEPSSSTTSQEKPFKSRFLKTTSFDSGSSPRLANGFENTSADSSRRDDLTSVESSSTKTESNVENNSTREN